MVKVICHTLGCINAEKEILLEGEVFTVICGPCGQEITDKQEVLNGN